MKDKKHVKYTKYKKFRHSTESKRKNMVGNNPEVERRKAISAALSPTYFSNSTSSAGQVLLTYTPKNEK